MDKDTELLAYLVGYEPDVLAHIESRQSDAALIAVCMSGCYVADVANTADWMRYRRNGTSWAELAANDRIGAPL